MLPLPGGFWNSIHKTTFGGFINSLRACMVTDKESIDLMILHYHWNKDFVLEIYIFEDFTLILVYIDAYCWKKNRVRCANPFKWGFSNLTGGDQIWDTYQMKISIRLNHQEFTIAKHGFITILRKPKIISLKIWLPNVTYMC